MPSALSVSSSFPCPMPGFTLHRSAYCPVMSCLPYTMRRLSQYLILFPVLSSDLPCPRPVPQSTRPFVLSHSVPCPALPCLILSCPALPCLTLPCPAHPIPAQPSPAQPSPAQPSQVKPGPAQACPTLPLPFARFWPVPSISSCLSPLCFASCSAFHLILSFCRTIFPALSFALPCFLSSAMSFTPQYFSSCCANCFEIPPSLSLAYPALPSTVPVLCNQFNFHLPSVLPCTQLCPYPSLFSFLTSASWPALQDKSLICHLCLSFFLRLPTGRFALSLPCPAPLLLHVHILPLLPFLPSAVQCLL